MPKEGTVAPPRAAKFKCMGFEGFGARRIGNGNNAAGTGLTGPTSHQSRAVTKIGPFRSESRDSDRDEWLAKISGGRRKRQHRPPWWPTVGVGGRFFFFNFHVDARGSLTRGRVPDIRRRVPVTKKWREFHNFLFLEKF